MATIQGQPLEQEQTNLVGDTEIPNESIVPGEESGEESGEEAPSRDDSLAKLNTRIVELINKTTQLPRIIDYYGEADDSILTDDILQDLIKEINLVNNMYDRFNNVTNLLTKQIMECCATVSYMSSGFQCDESPQIYLKYYYNNLFKNHYWSNTPYVIAVYIYELNSTYITFKLTHKKNSDRIEISRPTKINGIVNAFSHSGHNINHDVFCISSGSFSPAQIKKFNAGVIECLNRPARSD